jgi:hypothetical protein
MATTTNFGWETPDDTDLVKDGALAMRTLGNSIDSSFVDLKGGTTGQILSKASNTDLDYTWINNDQGDITAVTAGTGLTGGGTTGAVTLTNDMATTITAAGDIVVGTGSGTYDNLPIGTTGQVLTADTTVSPYKVKWATASSTPSFVGCSVYATTHQTISNNTFTDLTWNTEIFDTDEFHSTTTNTARMTIPTGKGGYYRVTCRAYWNAASATGRRVVSIFKNGTRWNNGGQPGDTSAGPAVTTSQIMNLVAGDYITMAVYQNSGGNMDIYRIDDPGTGGYQSQFEIEYLGA